MVVVIGVIALLASWIGIRTVALELANGQSTRRRATTYGVLVQAFVAAMLLAVLAANVGVLWVAVEATTIVTTFLVGHRRTKGALEASWKYIVICSVGIALAFLGTVFVYLAALHAGGHSADALDWTSLMAHARHLDPSVMRLAFALLVLGYGTKVGLAPMHSWLPDAHSQAPAPDLRPHVRRAAHRGLLRHPALQGGGGPGRRSRVRPEVAGHRGAPVVGRGRLAAAHPTRLQADARLLQHRAHGAHRSRRRGGHPARHRRRAAPHPRPRLGQERACS